MYPLRVIHDLRPALPWTIYALPFKYDDGSGPAAYEHRLAVHWDEDNDERIHAAVLDVYFRRPKALMNLYAVGERKGNLSIWVAAFPVADQNAWAAASAGPSIQDSWPVRTINTVEEIRRTGGRSQATMDDDVVARKFSPDHDQLNWLINLFQLGPSGPRLPW